MKWRSLFIGEDGFRWTGCVHSLGRTGVPELALEIAAKHNASVRRLFRAEFQGSRFSSMAQSNSHIVPWKPLVNQAPVRSGKAIPAAVDSLHPLLAEARAEAFERPQRTGNERAVRLPERHRRVEIDPHLHVVALNYSGCYKRWPRPLIRGARDAGIHRTRRSRV